jgi:hypothetical protein
VIAVFHRRLKNLIGVMKHEQAQLDAIVDSMNEQASLR